ncbi:MAG: PEP-CTERM sorting domain-containing protein [Armatimonadetes bacterium]|nr:PEP-CTERM sorting domain-containing protein [Armatimonadota bacterium]
MKRILFVASLAVVAAASQAAVNLNISNPVQVVALPNVGTIGVVFSGTVTTWGGFAPSNSWAVELPSDGTNFLGGAIDPGFAAYAAAGVVNSNYAGNLFTIFVNSTDLPGVYDLNNSGFGFSPFAEMIVSATRNGVTAVDNEFFSVEITPVPEPASLAILGLAAAALARRKK